MDGYKINPRDSVIANLAVSREALYGKICDLFDFRKLEPYLIICGLPAKRISVVIKTLTGLQKCIYALDYYGEYNWVIDSERIGSLWRSIYEALGYIGYGYEESRSLTRDIKTYQNIEVGLRYGKTPTNIGISEYYYLKTCDVRLARYIIYKYIPIYYKGRLNIIWAVFDTASEICDDLEDVIEDLFTYNSNRILASIKEKGMKRTYEEYANFLRELERTLDITAIKGSKGNGVINETIYDWAFTRVQYAKRTLSSFFSEGVLNVYKESWF